MLSDCEFDNAGGGGGPSGMDGRWAHVPRKLPIPSQGSNRSRGSLDKCVRAFESRVNFRVRLINMLTTCAPTMTVKRIPSHQKRYQT